MITEDDSWTKMKISYFLHSRNEFYLINQLFTHMVLTNRTSEHKFMMPFPSNWAGHPKATSAVRVFATNNGLRTSRKINEIRTTFQNFTENAFYFNLYIDSLSPI